MDGHRFTVVLERDEAGFVYGRVPRLPEVQTQGRTMAITEEMVRDAIRNALEIRRRRGEAIPAVDRSSAS